ncbi:MAG: hypothetical protein MUO62_12315 [Anaerolineales bacterium]|nr:hypothetical protein [Anaerolineales bacterium]
MAERRFILEILKELQEYYRQKYNPTQVRIISRQLAPIPDLILRQAVNQVLETEDNWLPKGGRLVEIAKNIAGFNDFNHLPQPIPTLSLSHQLLKNDYFHHGILDPAEWENLIEDAKGADAVHNAQAIRASFKVILELAGIKAPPSEPAVKPNPAKPLHKVQPPKNFAPVD